MRGKRTQQDQTTQLSGAQISTKRPFRSIGPGPTVLESGERAPARAQGQAPWHLAEGKGALQEQRAKTHGTVLWGEMHSESTGPGP